MQPEFTETSDFAEFKACILRKTGIDLNQYKQQQMHRRLCGMVERSNASSFMGYLRVLERDPDEYTAFLDRLTINVSELFRNPEKWQELRAQILPMLLTRRKTLKIWSAGCSYGAEPYSLAILLDQLTPGVIHTLHATDLDKNILAKAGEGKFTAADVRNLDATSLSRYFTRLQAEPAEAHSILVDGQPQYQVKASIRTRVRFRAHNLLADSFESDYDLICCRNVVIYFTEEAKERLFERLYAALAPGGVLLVGGTERIFRYRQIGFETPLPFFYRRAA